jgi:hypothetical protein
MFAAIAVVALSVVAAAPAPPTRPVVPPSFSSTVNITAFDNGQVQWVVYNEFVAPQQVCVVCPTAYPSPRRLTSRQCGRVSGRACM